MVVCAGSLKATYLLVGGAVFPLSLLFGLRVASTDMCRLLGEDKLVPEADKLERGF